MRVWIGRREQTRRTREGLLVDRLDEREQRAYLGGIARAAEELAEVDAIWYIRGKVAFLFEVEWTAMLGETAPAPARADPAGRLADPVPGHRARARASWSATSSNGRRCCEPPSTTSSWHIVKSDHLRAFLARDPLDLDDLEPYLGLDPLVERTGEQLPLFGG